MIPFMEWVQSFSTPFLDHFFLMVTNLANELLFVLIVVIIYWCISKQKGFNVVCALLLSGMININLKELFQIPRPFTYSDVARKDLHTSYGYSFPSAHAQLTSSFFTSLCLMFRRPLLIGIGCFFTLLIGFSRIYLGVHTPLDVFCGILFGILIVSAAHWGLDRISRTKKYWLCCLFVLPGLFGSFYTNDPDISKATFLLIGFLSGFFLENKYLHFSVSAPFLRQIWKVCMGFCVILAIQFCLKLFGNMMWLNYCRYFLVGFAITYLCPWIFQKTEARFS